jgi:hypothetical protein
MQLALSFLDMKSQHFGAGLECTASQGAERFTGLVLIASLAAILLWLIGTAAERGGVHERMRRRNPRGGYQSTESTITFVINCDELHAKACRCKNNKNLL